MDNLGVHLRHFYLGSRVTGAVWPLLTAPYKNTYLLTYLKHSNRPNQVLSNIQSERVNKSNKIFLLIPRSQPGSKGQGLEQVKSYVLIARRQFPIYLIATLTLIITILNFQNFRS